MTSQSTEQKIRSTHHTGRVSFDELGLPGAYVCNDNGNLFRVPDDSLVSGRSPLLEIVSKVPVMMTRISDDPWVPISKARGLAADADLYINF